MSIAYLVLAHADPVHLGRLLGAIASDDSEAFVHIDAKSDIAAFASLRAPRVHFVEPRVPVYWGDYSQVEAILALLRTALAAPRNFSRFVLLSGADFPLRSTAYIERFFAAHPQTEFMNLVQMPADHAGKPLSRVTSFHRRHADPFSRVERKLRRALVRFGLAKVERDHRRALGDIAPFGGSTWWALTRPACLHLLQFVDQRRAVVRFFHNAVYPDELMFHTIIGNSPFRAQVTRNVTYTDWRKGGSNPAAIGAEHVSAFQSMPEVSAHDAYGAGEVLFARKIGSGSPELVDRLETMRADKGLAAAATR
jgi:hypothetical protein